MSKVDYRRLPQGTRASLEASLLASFRTLLKSGRGERFLRAFLTRSEIVMLARRLDIARRLLQGQGIYRIREELKVGLDTIYAVSEWLEDHADDYRRLFPPPPKHRGKASTIEC